MLCREVVTLGSSEEDLYINTRTHSFWPDSYRLCGTPGADGRRRARCSPQQVRTCALFTALHLLRIMCATAPTGGEPCSMLAHALGRKERTHTFTQVLLKKNAVQTEFADAGVCTSKSLLVLASTQELSSQERKIHETEFKSFVESSQGYL
ncbi:hypothetical protein ILYODFUR_031695 [Ilyodon furcidens]|uniref:Uncharacterized protein n=1 Tax=Ilyodon furcidens TaxID=33524 RepID=A0ABV0UX61_9TELE